MAWTDEKRAQAIEMYEEREPTPENSVEIVKEIAEELDETPNGVRMVLQRAEVYVKKAAATKASGGEDKPKRVSKADAIEQLTQALNDVGAEVDSAIVDKLTGKAALYFAGVISNIK